MDVGEASSASGGVHTSLSSDHDTDTIDPKTPEASSSQHAAGKTKSTAKERRRAKREAERATLTSPTINDLRPICSGLHSGNGVGAAERTTPSTKTIPPSPNSPEVSSKLSAPTAANPPTSNPSNVGSTAKERRAAKRAAAQAAAVAETTTESSIPSAITAEDPAIPDTPIVGSTAKERRASRRVAARAAAGTAELDAETPGQDDDASNLTGAATNAKERRRLRREEERKKREREGSDIQGSTEAPPTKRSKGSKATNGGRERTTPNIVFVGQLAFSTTAKGLEEYIRSRAEVEGKVSVRLLTKKGTNPPRSRGMAFVELEDAEAAYRCLGLHHSRLDGRLLNVERTSGGGKDKRGQRIESKRKEQKEFMKGIVQRVLEEFTKAGKLGEDELDDAAKAVLEKMEAKVMERAVKDYCDKPDRLDLHNPSAWFTHHAHQLAFKANPDSLDADAKAWRKDECVKAAGRDRSNNEKRMKRDRGDPAGGRGAGGRGRGAMGGRGRGGEDSRAGRNDDKADGKAFATSNKETEAGFFARDRHSDGLEEVGEARRRKVESSGDRGRGNSDLASIFPSLRGRGQGRGGAMGGRGAGGQGFHGGIYQS